MGCCVDNDDDNVIVTHTTGGTLQKHIYMPCILGKQIRIVDGTSPVYDSYHRRWVEVGRAHDTAAAARPVSTSEVIFVYNHNLGYEPGDPFVSERHHKNYLNRFVNQVTPF